MLRRSGAVFLVAAAVAAMTSCGDGRPAFCDDLARASDMKSLTRALESQDLEQARDAAEQFRELADGAPEDIRSDMDDLADVVSDIVELLGDERSAVPGAANPGKGDAATLQQDREELNRRLDDMSTTSSRVERWALRSCGLDLT